MEFQHQNTPCWNKSASSMNLRLIKSQGFSPPAHSSPWSPLTTNTHVLARSRTHTHTAQAQPNGQERRNLLRSCFWPIFMCRLLSNSPAAQPSLFPLRWKMLVKWRREGCGKAGAAADELQGGGKYQDEWVRPLTPPEVRHRGAEGFAPALVLSVFAYECVWSCVSGKVEFWLRNIRSHFPSRLLCPKHQKTLPVNLFLLSSDASWRDTDSPVCSLKVF